MGRITQATALLFFFLTLSLTAPVTAAGISVADGVKIVAADGATSPVITITDSDIAEDGTVTVDISTIQGLTASGTFTDQNIAVADTAAAADWTFNIDLNAGTLTLASTGGPTVVGETVTVTFTGGAGNPWVPDTGGELSFPVMVTRDDGAGSGPFTFVIETVPSGGLSVADGIKITTVTGTTSPVLTITDSDILEDGTIEIDLSPLAAFTASGSVTDANIDVSDTAASAAWTSSVGGNLLILTSTGGPTAIGETVTVTFMGGAGNPWVGDSGGEQTVSLTAVRGDGAGAGSILFVIETVPAITGSLSIIGGQKITGTDGATLPVITITDNGIAQDGTLVIDVSPLAAYTASGSVTDANIDVSDTAVSATWSRMVIGNILTLTSSGGPTAAGETVTVNLTGGLGNPWIGNTNGEKTIVLTAVRTDSNAQASFNVVIETAPPPGYTVHADFVASPTAGLTPLTVTFTDKSSGNPSSWNWDFGDGGTSAARNPVHTYAAYGTYTVELTVMNAYGSSSKLKTDYIRVQNGGFHTANTTIAGLTLTESGGSQLVTVDTGILQASLVPNTSVLVIQPPADRGWSTITIYAFDGTGFSASGNLVTGNITGVRLVSGEIAPTAGFSAPIGEDAFFNYSTDLPWYPANALLSTTVLEGIGSDDESKLVQVLTPNKAFIVGTAYTAKITRTNFPHTAPVRITMSVNSSWNPSLAGGPGIAFIWKISEDRKKGQIFPTQLVQTDPLKSLDYYEAVSASGFSTFGLSSVGGNNNPFQLVEFLVTSYIDDTVSNPDSSGSPSDLSGGTGAGTGVSAIQQEPVQQPQQPAPGSPPEIRSIDLFINDRGLMTQTTLLTAADNLATVEIGRGVTALDSQSGPLSSVSIAAIPPGNLPAVPLGSGFSFAGRAYDLQPDGATFSPAITISFTAPEVAFGQEFSVKTYDRSSGTWQDIPSSYNPETGIITAQVSHFCSIAVFAKTVTGATPVPATPSALQKAPVPSPTIKVTPLSNFAGLVLWLVNRMLAYPILVGGIIVMVVALFLYNRKRRRERLFPY